MPETTFPLVDVNDIVRAVGGAAFYRGQVYAKGGAVVGLDWDAADQRLTAKVQGNDDVPYRANVQLARKGGGTYSIVDGLCTCPVSYDCKHVAAAVVQSNMTHIFDGPQMARPVAAAPSSWKDSLNALLGNEGSITAQDTAKQPRITPMGLQFELRSESSGATWSSRSTRPSPDRRLGVRPVVKNARGNWVMNSLSWKNIGFQTRGLHLDTDQHRWFTQFPALHRDNGSRYFGQNDSWLYLDHFSNPLLWQLLQEALRLGIEFVGSKKNVEVFVGAEASLCLDATHAEDAVKLCPVLDIDGRQHSVDLAGTIGTHGVYARTGDCIALGPVTRALTEQDNKLLRQKTPVIIPEAESGLFLETFYPQLRQSIGIISSDGSVDLPEIKPPVLVATATFEPEHRLRLSWDWEYGEGTTAARRPLEDDGRGNYRDRAAEAELLAAAGKALHGQVVAETVFEDMDAAEFTEQRLPAIEAVDGVRVDVVGEKPDYRELTETPELTVSTVESDQPDWFDLGVMVTVGGHTIPFDHLFRGLAKGKKKLLMTDGSYLSLKQPVFEELHRLIDEAKELQEWEAGTRISKYNASLWSDFEDLADETVEAQDWRATVTGLLQLEQVEQTPLPEGVHASLRPYQLAGFNWLAFLWEHNLGGILADDMGLGKTLQTLALLEHVRATCPNRKRFLVVAPTSVVPNWVSEARKFTPGLSVVALTDTEAKARLPLAEQIGEADVVITSYTLFRLDSRAYTQQHWDGLILDEAQFVKNRATRAHQCARDLKAPFKLAITGTPMENNLMELWSLLAIVAPGLFPSARKFTEDYQRPIERRGSNKLLQRLRRRISPLMMRRTKEVVAADLPEKQEQELHVELDPKHRTIYDTFLQRERQKLLGLLEDFDRNKIAVFRSLTLLRMLSLDASLLDEKYSAVPSRKIEVLFEHLEDVVAEGHKALVFSQFTSFLKKVAAQLEARGIPYCYLDGSTRRRSEVIDRFKSGEAPVFLISLKAGGFGLNLTEADYCFLLDPWWNPATEAQAVDRTHRIGQTRNVMVYRMISAGTIEEKVMALKGKKADLFASVMNDDGVFSSAMTADDIRGLLGA